MGVLATNRFTHSSVWAVCLPVYANGDRGEHVLDEPQIHVLRVYVGAMKRLINSTMLMSCRAGYLPLHLSVSALSRQRPTCRQCSGSRLERRKEPFCGVKGCHTWTVNVVADRSRAIRDSGYKHALRLYRDKSTYALRLEASVLDGEMQQ
jgi:hypothetical protein